MLSQRSESPHEMREAVDEARALLAEIAPETPWAKIRNSMTALGLLVGWGDTAGRVLETLDLFAEVVDAPSPAGIEDFLSRVPMIFSVAIFTPHGFFGQSNVLGLPDTGGQGVYILDQVRALEKERRERLRIQGIDTDPELPPSLDEPGAEPADPLGHDWFDAVERFAESDHAAEIFGEEYRFVYTAVKNDEVQTLTSLITPVEYRYYLSRL